MGVERYRYDVRLVKSVALNGYDVMNLSVNLKTARRFNVFEHF